MVETGCALLLVAICSTIAAIVGGNVSLPGAVRFGNLSRGPRVLLGLFAGFTGFLGLALLVIGLVQSVRPSSDSDAWYDYVDASTSICDQLAKAQAEQSAYPADATTPDEYLASSRRLIDLQDIALRELRLLPVPNERASVVVAWDKYQSMIEAAESATHEFERAGDTDAYQEALTHYEMTKGDYNSTARSFGLTGCVVT